MGSESRTPENDQLQAPSSQLPDMNREAKSRQADDAAAGSSNARELFVLSDFRSLPAAELRALCGSLPSWISALVRYKILRAKSPPAYALELLRLTQCDAAHVPKRMVKHLDSTKKQLQKLGFQLSFYANLPALGKYSSALMGMSQEDGEIHFCLYQVARQTAQGVIDESHFAFLSWLRDDQCLATLSPLQLPPLQRQIELLVDRSEDPAAVLKSHRNRLLQVNPQKVSPSELFDRLESDYGRQIADLRRRSVIRAASAAEVARIRNDMRV